ncbi:MAG: hypothetical protein WCF65_04800 [Parachlamydiaceae bacterium]
MTHPVPNSQGQSGFLVPVSVDSPGQSSHLMVPVRTKIESDIARIAAESINPLRESPPDASREKKHPLISNTLVEIAPSMYGGKQEEYQQIVEETIQYGIEIIQSGVDSGQGVAEIFVELLESFQAIRHDIAVEHQTERADLFGKPRVQASDQGYFINTGLYSQYDEYNRVFMEQFSQAISGMCLDKVVVDEKKKSIPENTRGHPLRFDVEFFDLMSLVNDANDPLENKEKDLQKDLGTKKSLNEIVYDYELLIKIKKQSPEIYQRLIRDSIRNKIYKTVIKGSKEYRHFALGTLRAEVSGKMYALSKYMTWLDVVDGVDPVKKMMTSSKVFVIHQDVFLIEETLKEVAKLFAHAMAWNPEVDTVEELKDRGAYFRFMFAQCTPSCRGDGAIGDWLELMLYRMKGFPGAHYAQGKMSNIEPLASISFARYRAEYDKIIILDDRGHRLEKR